MATPPAKTKNLLYLDQIILNDVTNREYSVKLFVGDQETTLEMRDHRTWIPARRPDVFSTSQILVVLQMKRGHLFWAKDQQKSESIDLRELFNDYWSSNKRELLVQRVISLGKHRCSLELQFSEDTTTESLRSSLHDLEGLLEKHSPLMSGSIERVVDKGLKFGAALAELNPVVKAVFSVARVTFELLQEQNISDQIPLCLLDRLQRILPFADKVAGGIMNEGTEILEEIIPRMFEVMYSTAHFLCDYVKRKRTGLAYLEILEAMDRKLTKIIEDFDRAVNVEALFLAKKAERPEQERIELERAERERTEREQAEQERAEQDLLLKRLKPVETSYHWDLRCMAGTRQSLLSQIRSWASEQKDESNIYWIYSLPGIGKTSLAHSICASLHNEGKHLAGAFFCRRGDPYLSEPKNILPTLIYKLAIIFPAFRSNVADSFRNDPNLTPESMQYSFFHDFICNLPCPPDRTLTFVIDAFDECGNNRSRPGILNVLTDAAAQAPWLRVIITSRPEVDIQRFFHALPQSSYLEYDLATDQDANADLRTFARSQFDLVASDWHLPTPWPEESLFNRIISRASGLFIFIKTVVLALENCENPTKSLEAALQDSAGTGLEALYKLYFGILQARIGDSNARFRQMIGVLLTTAPYRPLCDESIATLAGLDPSLVKRWVDGLSSLLYRDGGTNGAIRVRHLSISEFFISDDCPRDYQVNFRDSNVHLGIVCLKTMIDQLRFNICKLEDSRLANADVQGLEYRIKQNISDPLEYSSRYWSNHLCFTDNGDERVLRSLKEFFEGSYPLFWIEVLSIMGTVSIGAPSLRRVISWVKDTDSALTERLQDICHFIITFHTPISISAPHTYISTGPFLPSQSPLSTIFDAVFTKTMKMQSGKLLSWRAPPLKWIGHTRTVSRVCYSPDGCHIVTGSSDTTIRIWDAETGAVVGEPLEGHTHCKQSARGPCRIGLGLML